MLPDPVREAVERLVGPVHRSGAVAGGCIAHATRVEGERGVVFVKWARGGAFEAEAAGLRALRAHTERLTERLVVPEVLAVSGGYLVLEWLDPAAADRAFQEALGEGLAALHAADAPGPGYGFERDTVLGRLPQSNRVHADWPSFFRAERLAPQVALARRAGHWRPRWDARLDALYERLAEVLPRQPRRSLLHGDLWRGNAMATTQGPALVDPAVYVGDRETDLAMMELFGGLEEALAAYREAWPLDPGYAERRRVYQLYHALSHLNHFGAGYAGMVERLL